jgi:hypothetical protein
VNRQQKETTMKDSAHDANLETHQIAGHSVEIRRVPDHEELRIDGVRTKFAKTRGGYNLHAAAYKPPHKSLLEAVTSFLESGQRESGRK